MSDSQHNAMDKPRAVDHEALALFDEHEIKHAVLHKLYEIHRNDELHHLKETEKAKHIDAYQPLIYAKEEVSYGTNYFAKIRITRPNEGGACVHARVHKSHDGQVEFHSLHAPKESAIFSESDPLEFFNA